MKKTIVALTVAALAATSANAAVVYNQDGSKLEVNGGIRVLLVKDKNKRVDLQNDGSFLEFKGAQELGNVLSAFGVAKVKLAEKAFGENYNGSSVFLDKLYAGFKFDRVGSLSFGRQATIADGLDATDYTYGLSGVNLVKTSGDKVVTFKSADFGGFSAGWSYVFDKDPSKADVNNRAYVLGAAYEKQFNDVGVKFGLGYSHNKVAEKVSEKAVVVGAEVSYAGFALGLDYSQIKANNNANLSGEDYTFTQDYKFVGFKPEAETTMNKYRVISLGAKYQVNEKSKVYAVYSWGKGSGVNTAVEIEPTVAVAIPGVVSAPIVAKGFYKVNAFALGADYNIHQNVVTFVEGGKKQTKTAVGKVSDNTVRVGLRVLF
ncbi:porin [[Haemophilus] felis]|nr:porin [[Haemophilus] felis]